MKLKTFEQFSQETPDIIDFSVKKLMYVIRQKVEDNLLEGKNIFDFDFKEKDFNTKLSLLLNMIGGS